MKLPRRKKQNRAEQKDAPVGTKQAEPSEADIRPMINPAAAARDAWLEEQDILKDFYEHVVLQDSDEGLPSIQSTLPKWLKAHLLAAYSAGYGHSSVRGAGLAAEIQRVLEADLEKAKRIRDLETALVTIRDALPSEA